MCLLSEGDKKAEDEADGLAQIHLAATEATKFVRRNELVITDIAVELRAQKSLC